MISVVVGVYEAITNYRSPQSAKRSTDLNNNIMLGRMEVISKPKNYLKGLLLDEWTLESDKVKARSVLFHGQPSVRSVGPSLLKYSSTSVKEKPVLINNGRLSTGASSSDTLVSLVELPPRPPPLVEVKMKCNFVEDFGNGERSIMVGGSFTYDGASTLIGSVFQGITIWCLGMLNKGVTLLITKLASENEKLHQENKALQNQVIELKCKVVKQTQQLKETINTVGKLKEKYEEHNQRNEIQRNDLKDHQISMYEFFLSLQLPKPLFPAIFENSKQFWVLRKHQRNLIALTKPYIDTIIIASVEAGIVSRNIGRCATKKCSIPNHDCTSGFYKALLVNVSDSPHILEKFLQMMVDKFESEPGGQLCVRMLKELYA